MALVRSEIVTLTLTTPPQTLDIMHAEVSHTFPGSLVESRGPFRRIPLKSAISDDPLRVALPTLPAGSGGSEISHPVKSEISGGSESRGPMSNFGSRAGSEISDPDLAGGGAPGGTGW